MREIQHMDAWDAIVVGAGPAGLFTALHLGRHPLGVLVLEKKKQPGRKLLLTGGGHCNFTHAGGLAHFLGRYGEGGEFLRPALSACSSRKLIRFFSEHGVPSLTEPGGRVLPESGRAGHVLDALLQGLGQGQAELRTSTPVQGVSREPSALFRVDTPSGEERARCVVLSCGGKSYPATGSTGDAYAWAERLGHRVIPPRPALTALLVRPTPLTRLTGLALPATPVSLWKKGQRAHRLVGDVLITHQGLSGPAIQDLSRHAEPGDRLTLQLVPAPGEERLIPELLEAWEKNGSRMLSTFLQKLGLTARLAEVVSLVASADPLQKLAKFAKKDRLATLNALCDFPLTVRDRAGFEQAMVTQGGVCRSEVLPATMESLRQPGLFFAGEVLDVDGDCGGYNLQAAFSTGYLAAQGVRRYLETTDRDRAPPPGYSVYSPSL